MTPPTGFRTSKSMNSDGASMGTRPDVSSPDPLAPTRGADYAYRIAALTAGLVLLATVL
jgi:hypothetical protein